MLRNGRQYKMHTGPQQTYERSRVFTSTQTWTNITKKQPETAAGKDISNLRSDSQKVCGWAADLYGPRPE